MKRRIPLILLICIVTVSVLTGCPSQEEIPFVWEETTLSYGGTSFSYCERFFHKTEEFDAGGAVASMHLATAAFGKGNANANADAPLREYLTMLGFSDVESFGYDLIPAADSIAAGFAHKTVAGPEGDFRVVAAAVRGGNYGAEWAGNFTLGEDVNHAGFDQAAMQVFDHLQQYLSAHPSDLPTVVWTAGYSRGAAVSNLLAARLADANIPNTDVCAYTFETPAPTRDPGMHDVKYKGIYNIVCEEDLVTKVVPVQYGFGRYGADVILPRLSDPAVSEAVGLQYAGSFGAQMPVISPEADKITDDFISYLTSRYTDQHAYVSALQDGLRSVLSKADTMNMNFNDLQSQLSDDISGLVTAGLLLNSPEAKILVDRTLDTVYSRILQSVGLQEQRGFINELLRIAFAADPEVDEARLLRSTAHYVTSHFMDLELAVLADDALPMEPSVDAMLTSAGTVLPAHLPDLCLARILSMQMQ